MSKKVLVVIELPHPKPRVQLEQELAVLLRRLIAAGAKGVNYSDLSREGFRSIAHTVARLHSYGAIICAENTQYMHLHYYYKGWHRDR